MSSKNSVWGKPEDFPELERPWEPEVGDRFVVSINTRTKDRSWTGEVWTCVAKAAGHIQGRASKKRPWGNLVIFLKHEHEFHDAGEFVVE